MGPVSQYVAQLVRRKLDQHLVLVWYDPTRAFAELVDHLDLPPGPEWPGSPAVTLNCGQK